MTARSAQAMAGAAPEHQIMVLFAEALLAALLVAALASLLLSARIARPLTNLAMAARRVGAGDFSSVVPEEGTEELRDLARSFMAMEGQLSCRERDLEEARRAAESASRAKSRFLAVMSHELRTPLNVILLSAELLENEARDAGRGEGLADFQRIRGAARSLLARIEDVLDFTRLEAGSLESVLEPFSPAESLRNVVDRHLPSAQDKGLVLDLELDPDLPARVWGDALHFRRAMGILVGNAVKFTFSRHGREGRVAVKAWLEGCSPAGASILVQVGDNGIGISKDVLPRLFEPFTLEDDSATRRFEGIGLSTTICARLVEGMGGTLRVSSEAGEGTLFTLALRLPLT
jgi:signal transduction histidine kinase